MNIIEIKGSVAQQMFQYALYTAMRHTDPHTLINVAEPGDKWIKSRFSLQHYLQASAEQLKPYGMHSTAARLMSRIIKPAGRIVTEPADATFNPEVLNLNDCYLRGQWLSPKYFASTEDEVREAFVVTDRQLPARSIDLIKQLRKPQCVAMLVSEPQNGDVTADYFNWAVASVMADLGQPQFVVLTTDPEWVNANINFQGAKAQVTSYPTANEATIIAYLMRASHCIISPSLNGWWGAWLNTDPDRIVIAPKNWSKTHPLPDLIPAHWTTIPLT